MPPEIRKYVLQVQAHLKIKTGNGKYSQQQAINWLIKDHKEKVDFNTSNK